MIRVRQATGRPPDCQAAPRHLRQAMRGRRWFATPGGGARARRPQYRTTPDRTQSRRHRTSIRVGRCPRMLGGVAASGVPEVPGVAPDAWYRAVSGRGRDSQGPRTRCRPRIAPDVPDFVLAPVRTLSVGPALEASSHPTPAQAVAPGNAPRSTVGAGVLRSLRPRSGRVAPTGGPLYSEPSSYPPIERQGPWAAVTVGA
jgi:hypothetical protein